MNLRYIFEKNFKRFWGDGLHKNLKGAFSFFVVIITVVLLFLTLMSMGKTEFASLNHKSILRILYADIALLVMIAYVFSDRIHSLWKDRKRKGFQLQKKLVYIFSLISIIPSFFMIIFAGIFFHKGVDSWFNSRNEAVLIEASNVAEAYRNENIEIAKDDAIGVARAIEVAISSAAPTKVGDKAYVKDFVEDIMEDWFTVKNIHSGILFNPQREILAVSRGGLSLGFIPIMDDSFRKCSEVEALPINTDDQGDILFLVNIKIPLHGDAYLLIRKKVDNKIIEHVEKTKTAYAEYNELKSERLNFEVLFIIVFLIFAFLLVLTAINFAIKFSSHLMNPIFNLIDSAENIKEGDLNVRAESGFEDPTELKILIKTFNAMVSQVQIQQIKLKIANSQLDEKIQFISGVLGGVSSGVIGLDKNYRVNIYNDVAKDKIGKKLTNNVLIFDIFPQISQHIDKLNTLEKLELQLDFSAELKHFLFSIKVVPIRVYDILSYIITIDDITNLVNAQRQAAWADVARRVAHEIKNPLTPIQLAAERLSRKYSDQISDAKETFDKLINSIIKQVGDIKRLIDEFNFFARLPEPIFKNSNIFEILKQAVFFIQNAYPDVTININTKNISDDFNMSIDERLIHQVFINILQNAVNAIKSREIENSPLIVVSARVTMLQSNNKVVIAGREDESTCRKVIIEFEDNGPGLPENDREKLTDPYFTLMPKGTGLGLAIVKKIVQDHSGKIFFNDGSLGGAKVTLSFPKNCSILKSELKE